MVSASSRRPYQATDQRRVGLERIHAGRLQYERQRIPEYPRKFIASRHFQLGQELRSGQRVAVFRTRHGFQPPQSGQPHVSEPELALGQAKRQRVDATPGQRHKLWRQYWRINQRAKQLHPRGHHQFSRPDQLFRFGRRQFGLYASEPGGQQFQGRVQPFRTHARWAGRARTWLELFALPGAGHVRHRIGGWSIRHTLEHAGGQRVDRPLGPGRHPVAACLS
ncbi:hypothetical protein D3C72_1359810 [compost metagenome]